MSAFRLTINLAPCMLVPRPAPHTSTLIATTAETGKNGKLNTFTLENFKNENFDNYSVPEERNSLPPYVKTEHTPVPSQTSP